MKKVISICLIAGTMLSLPLFARLNTSRTEMIKDIDIIQRTFEERYAPSEWKKEYTGWELVNETTVAKNTIINNPSINLKDFWNVITHLFESTKDYHVTVDFFSTEKATLPFNVRHINGRYYFSYISKALAEENFPFKPGDELIAMDGMLINDVIKDLKKYHQVSNFEGTDMRFAALHLTHRVGALGHDIPYGPITLTGTTKFGQRLSFQTLWKYEAEQMLCSFGSAQNCSENNSKADLPIYRKQFIFPQHAHYCPKTQAENENTERIGAKCSPLPNLGAVLWKSDEDSPFDAHFFELAHHIGACIRIPTYSPREYSVEEGIEEFSQLIQMAEATADFLVIDQLSNPGGDMLYLFQLLSMLTDKPLQIYPHRIKLTQDEVFEGIKYIPWIEDLDEEKLADYIKTMNYESQAEVFTKHGIKNYFRDILEEWNQKNYLTKPIYLMGIEYIPPHPSIHFTKPIVVLTDELDFSCADFFPEILQRNGRALIFGSRTAGAGGAVESFSFPNTRGIAAISYTSTIAIRPDGSYLENQGVIPDVPYQITAYDIQNQYAGYVGSLHQTIQAMLSF